MKELLGTAFNAALIPAEGGQFIGVGEVILVLSEPVYSMDPTGQMNKSRGVHQERFTSTAKGLREIAKSLGEFADNLEELEASVPQPAE